MIFAVMEKERTVLIMAVCEHCKSRHTWDCDDGLPYPKGGCDNFILDVETLTKSQ